MAALEFQVRFDEGGYSFAMTIFIGAVSCVGICFLFPGHTHCVDPFLVMWM